MTPPRLVLDTNVLLSALLFHAGTLSWLRAAWQSEVIRPLASRDTTAELIRVHSCNKTEHLKHLREVPIWWTENDKPRAFSDTPSMLFDRPEDWPDWLPVDRCTRECGSQSNAGRNERKSGKNLVSPGVPTLLTNGAI